MCVLYKKTYFQLYYLTSFILSFFICLFEHNNILSFDLKKMVYLHPYKDKR